MLCLLEILKCILCCADEPYTITETPNYLSSFLSSPLIDSARNESIWPSRPSPAPVEYKVVIGSETNQRTSVGSSDLQSVERVRQFLQNYRNSGSYNIHIKPPHSSAKPILRPPSPPPSMKTSSSPKCLVPSKPSIPSIKPSSLSAEPSASLKPTLSSVPSKPSIPSTKPSSSSAEPSASLKPTLSSVPSKPSIPSTKPSSSSAEPSASLKPTLSSVPSKPSIPSTKPSSSSAKPSASPKPTISSVPSKPSIPSTKTSSSSAKPSASLKPTLSSVPSSSTTQQGKGTYKLVDPKDKLPIYMIPEDIEDLFKRHSVPEVLKKPLSPSTYKDYFAALLHAEGYYIKEWSDFELENVTLELHPASIYEKSGENKMGDKTFVVFKVDSLSKTRRPFLLSRDFVFAKRLGKEIEPFQGVIYRVQKSTTVLVEFGDEFHSQHDSTHRYDISFSFNRVCLRRAHEAIAAASASLIGKFLFPSISQHPLLYNHNLYRDENSTVHRILNVRGSPPFLVKGPLCATYNGNSKSFSKQLSRTGQVVKEAVLQIYQRHPESKILVCTPINSTCDVLTRSLKTEIPASDIFRANATFREIEGVPIDILPSCLYKRETECFSCPSLCELKEFRVIFSTFMSSYRLYNAGILAGHFSHIFMVDASSATEPETMVALANFVDESTTLIVTGAPGNRSSTVRSDIARQKGLRISYFERLCELSLYKSGNSMFIAQLKDKA